ncbi:MAG: SUMF1/EgtB/PvdO family nonheme iron enzyme, partial [Myxococcota bacterium]
WFRRAERPHGLQPEEQREPSFPTVASLEVTQSSAQTIASQIRGPIAKSQETTQAHPWSAQWSSAKAMFKRWWCSATEAWGPWWSSAKVKLRKWSSELRTRAPIWWSIPVVRWSLSAGLLLLFVISLSGRLWGPKTHSSQSSRPTEKRTAQQHKGRNAPNPRVRSSALRFMGPSGYPQRLSWVKMRRIRTGTFFQGHGSARLKAPHAPRREVRMHSFWIDQHEVSVRQWQSCVRRGKCRSLRREQSNQKLPVRFVKWFEARRFCAWMGKRLPTEAEWERAARGKDTRRFPWGNQPLDCRRINYWRCRQDLQPVQREGQTLGDSPFGVYDMVGNVREWVEDCYHPEIYHKAANASPMHVFLGCKQRVIRG